ncbi:MAG: DeoR/GlpR family DNA-binding transcription regulator [Bacilli bacterium]|jgi:DeoR family fructose operon transcriptional repressor
MDNEKKEMFSSERFKLISQYLKEHNRATVEELAHVLYVSAATVRRDLSEMQKLGLIQRTHGGAVLLDASDEVSIFVRIEKNSADKEKTATLALNKLPSFSSIFIDNSSTCLGYAERMDFTYKTVITNGLQLAMKLASKKDVKVILLGGTVQYSTYSTSGELTSSLLDYFKADVMLSSCAGIRLDGSYEPSIETMEIKKKAFERSDKHILLVDKNKFSNSFPYRTEKLTSYDEIYTNADDNTILPYKQAGIRIFNK